MNESENWPLEDPEPSTHPEPPLPELPDLGIPGDEPPIFLSAPLPDPLPVAPHPPEPPPTRRGCWFTGLILVLVISLLGSGIASAFWLITRARSDTAVSAANANPPGRIAYINQNGQVVTIDPDGNNGRLLTDTTFNYQFPTWSPDGRSLAVIGDETIFLLPDQEGSEAVSLYTDSRQNPFYLYWSPDGRLLSFLTNDPRHGIGLRLVAADTPLSDRLLTTGSPVYWNWTSDSQKLLVHSGISGTDARLALLNTDSFENAEDIAPPGFFQTPGISANGRFWAYAEDLGDGTSWLVVTNRETGERWLERHSGMVAFSWSPVGSQLAFTNGAREGSLTAWGPLRLFNAETGETRLLSGNTNLAFFWSPDGRYLAAINTGDNSENFGTNVMKKDDGRRPIAAKPNLQPPRHEFNLAIINLETGEERQALSFVPTGLFISQFLPFFDQYALSHHIWSPNSDAVVLSVMEESGSQVKIIPVDGGPTTDLGRGDMPFWSPGQSNP